MEPRVHFAVLILVYAAFPLVFAAMRSQLRLLLLYAYVAITLTVGGFLGAVYQLPLAGDVTISAGSVAYGALMMSAVVLVVVGRDLQVLRTTIRVILMVTVFKLAVFALTTAALGDDAYPNPFETSDDVFSASVRSVLTGGALIIGELLLLVAVFEQAKRRVRTPQLLSALYVVGFVFVLVLDGLLFPLLFPQAEAVTGELIVSSVQAKLVLALAFAVPLVLFLVLFRGRLAAYEATPLRLQELFLSTRDDIVQHLHRTERELRETQQLFRQGFERAAVGMGLVEPGTGRYLQVNDALRRLHGGELSAAEGPLEEGTVEVEITRPDGSTAWLERTLTPVHDDDGGERALFVQVVDVSERKARERELERQVETAAWLARIRDALERDRFVLHGQPIVDLARGDVVFHELLLRLVGDDGEVVPPGAFLPTAEAHGVIEEIDRWVIARAARLAAAGTPVTVNLSAASIVHPGTLGAIEQALHETGADPARMLFEITETALVDNLDAGELFANMLAHRGCQIALDDFGTGFGGFTYLKRLPAQFLKIDMEFVRDLVHNERDRHVVRATVALAEGFGQRTIAEGVEDAETLELLRELGVDHAQGFHIGRPQALPATPRVGRS